METKRIIRNLLRSEISEGIKKDREIRRFKTIPPEIGFSQDIFRNNDVEESNSTEQEIVQDTIIQNEDPKPKREKIPRVKTPREKIPRTKTPRVKKSDNKGDV